MKKDNDFQIGVFLKDNYHLFVIIGVFGALSIYLNTMDLKNTPTVSIMLQIGIVSSLFLFVLVSGIIFFNALKSHDGPIPLSFFIPPSIGKLVRILFIVPFFYWYIAISYFVVNTFPGPSNVVFGYTLSWVAVMVFFVLLAIIEPKLKNKRFAGIFVLLLFLAVVSGLGNYYATKYDFVPVAFFCSSLASGSVIGLIIIPIAYFYEKYKIKKGNSNNKKNFERRR
ncbi:MAG: hypothetical protein ACXQT5_04395 [Candidatus Syntropharchaeia archaeon]